jgi:hypothetical protein
LADAVSVSICSLPFCWGAKFCFEWIWFVFDILEVSLCLFNREPMARVANGCSKAAVPACSLRGCYVFG